jgi:hypothetical protein
MRDVSIFSVLFDNNDHRAKGNIEVLDSNPIHFSKKKVFA